MLAVVWCLLLPGIAVGWVVREVRAAGRGLRPVRVGVVFSAALILAGSAVIDIVSRVDLGALAGMPRRYATYQPAPALDWPVLLAATGVGLPIGAFIGAIRTADGTISPDLTAARTRNRIIAAGGLVLLIVGLAGLALR